MTPDELKRWRSATPIRLTHDEDGNPLTETTGIATASYAADLEEAELVLRDADPEDTGPRQGHPR